MVFFSPLWEEKKRNVDTFGFCGAGGGGCGVGFSQVPQIKITHTLWLSLKLS